jgi:hypothetical protein
VAKASTIPSVNRYRENRGKLGLEVSKEYRPDKAPAYIIDQMLKRAVVGANPIRKSDQFWLLYADSTGHAGCTGEYSKLNDRHWNQTFVERHGY